MSMLDKDNAKEFADRIADINQQVQTGDVNFEQARVTIETYKWLASKYNPSTYGNVSSSTPETALNAIHLEALRSLPKD